MIKKLHRRSIRIPGADYSEPDGYFITVCSANRRNIFGKVEDGKMISSSLGEIVRDCWVRIPEHFPNASLKEFVVMPNHLHGIIALTVGARYIVPFDPAARRQESFQKPTSGTIPTIIRTIKAAVTRRARETLGMGSVKIWLRNYFERVLRDGKEYVDASRYILENPLRWKFDEENLARKIAPRVK